MTKNTTKISLRQRASIVLAQLYRVAGVHQEAGQILPTEPWLKVLANILSACPEGYDGDRRARNAPVSFGLSAASLALAARRCGLKATVEQIAAQVADTKEWRHHQSVRSRRPHYVQMKPDVIGKMLGVTDITRDEAKAWNVGTYGGSPADRKVAARERHRLGAQRRRQNAGAATRDVNLSRAKPWEAEGISRRTWERRRASYAENVTSPSATNKDCDAIRARQVTDAIRADAIRARQVTL
jgi:hypothetical protein